MNAGFGVLMIEAGNKTGGSSGKDDEGIGVGCRDSAGKILITLVFVAVEVELT
jgi:hypothetical protein